MADRTLNLGDLAASLQAQIESFTPTIEAQSVGTVLEVGDGIARVDGLGDAAANELVQFADGTLGIAFNLEADNVGVIILGEYQEIEEGQPVRATGRIASVPVGPALIGRVVNALGQPIDGKGPLATTRYRPVERIASGVIERQDVDTPVQTGIKAIDALTPIGRGQRELIIGDRQTGKSALTIDTIINQKGKGMACMYVAIGQKKAQVARLVATLERFGAMEYTTVVVASASEPAALQYIAPYAACAMGEEFMEEGVTIGGQFVNDVLVVYDDLSKHAWAYRQVSLLLRRPPGREAYPGDVFFLHSRLLERATRLSNRYVLAPQDAPDDTTAGVDGREYAGPRALHEAKGALAARSDKDGLKIVRLKKSGGSLTALPIIETLLGDISAYIPTNVISITDGQIFLEGDLFNAGIRPAINVGISVSRVGGAAQTKSMKQVAGRLRLDMSQYRELAAFAAFASDLDATTQQQLDRGRRLEEILKQPQYQPLSLAEEVMVLYAGVNGHTDKIPVGRMREWETAFHRFMAQQYKEVGDAIAEKKQITPDVEEKLKAGILAFNQGWS